ncbi:bifunctional hydroxymethylpyrimidine kinase/phosphomethylpyrimidine kinase [Cellulomonas sp. CW35]|uniref:bifunctional hydroxymethylpyrimidine kinase/phosphomethylpyrimidine kinase n=1 Tax=Cellulomonas sp. CW35 TaxID=3458249 RepID=UPI0040337D05
MSPSRVRALSIAGTDPTGGAGIQADLKSFAAHGAYGMAVVTALVAQNTRGVRAVHVPEPEFLRAQLEAVSDDVTVDSVKIGMLATPQVAHEVTAWLDRQRAAGRSPVVVLDPVMVATSGDRLLDPEAEIAVRELVGRADLVTPNLPELAVLVDEPRAQSWAQALDQATRLSRGSGTTVLLKGGHLGGPTSPDALVGPDGAVVEVAAQRVASTSTHGTGCSLSAAVAALRPARDGWPEAVREAKQWLTGAIAAGARLEVGAGHGPVDHLHHAPGLGARPFTAQVAGLVADAVERSQDLPFVRALADGSLPVGRFEEYVRQDALYLTGYARVLARASELAPDGEAQAFFARGAAACLDVERRLHEQRLARSARDGSRQGASASSVTTAYVDHLLAVAATGSYADVVAAVLPCYWVYADLGARLRARAGDLTAHPYGDWVGTYGDEEFAAVTAQARAHADAAGRSLDAAGRARMREVLAVSCEHEVAFFDQVRPAPGPARATPDELVTAGVPA